MTEPVINGVAIKDIPGALIDKMTYPVPIYGPRGELASSYNAAIDKQGQVKLTLDREKLAENIFLGWFPECTDWIGCDLETKNIIYKCADSIIASQATLFKVVSA